MTILPPDFGQRIETDHHMLIIIEGIDGAGKHTQTQLLKARLEADGRSVGTLAFPRYGKTRMALAAADYLNGKFGDISASPPQFPALLFAGDRLESKGLMDELLAANDVLLIDRYVPSNMAHQAAKAPAEERAALIEWIAGIEYDVYGLPLPDLTFYLDVPTKTSADLIARKAPRSYTDAKADLHEKDTDYLTTTRAAYDLVGATNYGGEWVRITCVDEHQHILPPQHIHDAMWQALQGRL